MPAFTTASALAPAARAIAATDPIAGWTVVNALGGLYDPNLPDVEDYATDVWG